MVCIKLSNYNLLKSLNFIFNNNKYKLLAI